MSNSFDLENFMTDETTIDHGILLPNEHNDPMLGADGEQVKFKLVSIDDPRYVKVQRRIMDERLLRSQAKRNKKNLNAEDMANDGVRLVASAIVGWTENLVLKGVPFRYSPENAILICERLPWIRDQIDEVINDRARFFKS